MKLILLAVVALFGTILASAYPDFFAKNSFLKALMSPEIITILIVPLTVTLASAANIHLTLGRVRERYKAHGIDISEEVSEARRELSENAWYLFAAFSAALIALFIKGAVSSICIIAFIHVFLIWILVLNLAVLYDIYSSVYLLASSTDSLFVGHSGEDRSETDLIMTDKINQRFDALLSAMVSKQALEVPVKEAQASSAALSEGSGDIQTPKGKSGATSSKR